MTGLCVTLGGMSPWLAGLVLDGTGSKVSETRPLPLLALSGSPLTVLSSLEEGPGVQVSWGGNSSPEDPGETCIQP